MNVDIRKSPTDGSQGVLNVERYRIGGICRYVLLGALTCTKVNMECMSPWRKTK